MVAAVLGSDPKSKLDEDLLRMKTQIETGHAPHDAAEKEPVLPLEQWLADPERLVSSLVTETSPVRLHSPRR